MTTKSNLWTGLAGTLAVTALVFAFFAGEPSPNRLASQAFMRQKLGWSQSLLEGLTLEKFDLVSKNALRMRDMSQSNLWFTVKNPDYMAQTKDYQKSIDALYGAAVDRNLDAATDAYVKVTRNCVECHRIVRLEQRKFGDAAAQPAK